MLPPAVKNNQNEFCIFVVSAWGTKPHFAHERGCFFFFFGGSTWMVMLILCCNVLTIAVVPFC